jgi:hypothetical protein
MPHYRAKISPTVEALPIPETGDYAVIKNGQLVIIKKADFEAEFEPVPGK